jgi:uncharacterized protein (TIGR03084 family)
MPGQTQTGIAQTMADLLANLRQQEAALDELLGPLGPQDWYTASAAPGWTVKDQVFHISYFDQVATDVVISPEGFLADLPGILADPDRYMIEHLAPGRAQAYSEVRDGWRRSRAAMLEAFESADPRARHPWFGPDMSTTSFATARLMEIFAHGQDIADGLHRPLDNNAGLSHIAHLGVITRSFSYLTRGLAAPGTPVRVVLDLPETTTREWGPPGAVDVIRGPARDFCLVVTQRRHPSDTSLEISGPAATEWMGIAQAFAGKPGAGRRPGQFPRAGQGSAPRGQDSVPRAQDSVPRAQDTAG